MKKLIALAIMICFSATLFAQFPIKINKKTVEDLAKKKDKKQKENTGEKQADAGESAGFSKSALEKDNWHFGGDNYASSIQSYLNRFGITEQGQIKMRSHTAVKKEGSNSFVFAKYLPELKPYVETENALGTIYISSAAQDATATSGNNSFTSSQNIYCNLVLANNRTVEDVFMMPAAQASTHKNTLTVGLDIYDNEGKKINTSGVQYTLNASQLKSNAIIFDLHPAINNIRTYYQYNQPLPFAITTFIKKTGNFKVVVSLENSSPIDEWGEVKANMTDRTIISSDFNYNILPSDIAALQQYNKDYEEAKKKKSSTEMSLPAAFSKPGTSPDASVTIANVTQTLKAVYPSFTIHKVVFENGTGPAWIIYKNGIGIPTEKYFQRLVFFTYTDKNGKCFIGSKQLGRSYAGGGKYNNDYILHANVDYDTKMIDCNKIK